MLILKINVNIQVKFEAIEQISPGASDGRCQTICVLKCCICRRPEPQRKCGGPRAMNPLPLLNEKDMCAEKMAFFSRSDMT